MKTEHYKRVEAFMALAGQNTPAEPTEPSEETRVLRAKLILEEVLETIQKGLGVLVTVEGTVDVGFLNRQVELELDADRLVFVTIRPYNEQETIDGCLDVSVVNTGTLVAIGVPDEQLLALVDENNLAKFGPGGYRREDGKWMKPPGHKPPAIAEWLEVYRHHLHLLKGVASRVDESVAKMDQAAAEMKIRQGLTPEQRDDLIQKTQAAQFKAGAQPEIVLSGVIVDVESHGTLDQGPFGIGEIPNSTAGESLISDIHKEIESDIKSKLVGEQAGPDIAEELRTAAYFISGQGMGIAENLLQAASEIDRLRKRWAVVEIVTGPGYECGVVHDVGRLSVAVRQVGKPWAGGVLDVPKSSLVVEEGHTAFVVCGSDGVPEDRIGVLNWQKIETAPKNQFVLLARRAGYVTQEWDYQVGQFTEGYHDRWDTIGNDAFDTQPEYWCPLPNAPEWKVPETEVLPVVDPQDKWD